MSDPTARIIDSVCIGTIPPLPPPNGDELAILYRLAMMLRGAIESEEEDDERPVMEASAEPTMRQ